MRIIKRIRVIFLVLTTYVNPLYSSDVYEFSDLMDGGKLKTYLSTVNTYTDEVVFQLKEHEKVLDLTATKTEFETFFNALEEGVMVFGSRNLPHLVDAQVTGIDGRSFRTKRASSEYRTGIHDMALSIIKENAPSLKLTVISK